MKILISSLKAESIFIKLWMPIFLFKIVQITSLFKKGFCFLFVEKIFKDWIQEKKFSRIKNVYMNYFDCFFRKTPKENII